MVSILLVEDDADKKAAIARVIGAAGAVRPITLVEVSTAYEALDALARTRFDLVVLDVALPRRHGEPADAASGVAILEELAHRGKHYLAPTHIVGLTGFPEVLAGMQGRFAAHMLSLTLFDPSSTEWEEALGARVRQAADAIAAVDREEAQPASDLAIVCALQLELNAVLRLPWGWTQVSNPLDHTIYWRGTYQSAKGEERIAHACLAARMGMPAAAAVAAKVVRWYRPRFLCMTGIAAGVRERVRLGDIIAADPCWDWGSGKWDLRQEEPRFSAAPYQIGLDPWIRERLRMCAAQHEWLAKLAGDWPGERMVDGVRLVVGPLATGAAVLADGATAARIMDQNRQVLGVEMEAYGVFAAAEEAAQPRPLAFVLKAVVDFADGTKDDRFQAFGAYASACALRYVAESHL